MLKLIAKFRMIGHEMRKQLSEKLTSEDKSAFKPFNSALESHLNDMDKEFALGYGNKDGCPFTRLLRMTFGEIGRAWGDTTALDSIHNLRTSYSHT